MNRKYRNYMPFRFVFNILLILLEIVLVMALVIFVTIQSRYSLIAEVVTQLAVAIVIIASHDNPDYKVPWLFFVLILPVVGFMCYFMFYSRKLSAGQRRRLRDWMNINNILADSPDASNLAEENAQAYSQATLLKELSQTHIYTDTTVKFFSLGDKVFPYLLDDLRNAEKFVFVESFIIQEGLFWNSVLRILRQKVAEGVEVRVMYDDIGCMRTLPGNYFKTLNKMGIKCVTFSRLRAQANNKFNNRNHRKIIIIDGRVAYTGGFNLADEYINERERFGHWKDVGIRLDGNAVNELTKLFLADFGSNTSRGEDIRRYYRQTALSSQCGYVVPFGDGPKPLYDRQVAKLAIINLLGQAKRYVYMTSPYLIVDSELESAIENAALRGVDVRLITPHIPDKKLVFSMTRSYYPKLVKAGVKIFEYTPGFIHSKMYLADGDTAIVGTVNLDYRSLVHHFENGVWMYRVPAIADMERDFFETQNKSTPVDERMLREHLPGKFARALLKIIAPLL